MSPISKPNLEEETLDLTLRPKNWADYVGQEHVKKNLMVIIDAAKQRREAPEHLLFYGTSGIGKTTLAHVVANEITVPIRVTSGPAIEKAGDLAAILTNLEEGAVLFVDEIHRLSRIVEEHLYAAMEERALHLVIGKGPMARTMTLELPHFTLIGATTRAAGLSSPLRNRFGATFRLTFYTIEDIKAILKRSALLLGISVNEEALNLIAERSRMTPRTANRILKRVRDFAQVKGEGVITPRVAEKAFAFIGIDEKGLDEGDRKLLDTLIRKFQGGPAGIQALAAASSEEEETILNMYEPFLLQLGFFERTPRGRTATKAAYQHMGVKYPKDAQRLL